MSEERHNEETKDSRNCLENIPIKNDSNKNELNARKKILSECFVTFIILIILAIVNNRFPVSNPQGNRYVNAIPDIMPEKDNLRNYSISSQEEAGVDFKRSLQTGVNLTVYTSEGEMDYIGADFMQDCIPTNLLPNVEVELVSYSPAMSQIPGIPITFGFNLFNTYDSIEISCVGGSMLQWDAETGEVTTLGNDAFFYEGDTIYWSPLSDDGLTMYSTGILIQTLKGDELVSKQTLEIKYINGHYVAECGKLF